MKSVLILLQPDQRMLLLALLEEIKQNGGKVASI